VKHKIKNNNKEDFIESCFIKIKDQSLSLIINTSKRYMKPGAYGSDNNTFELYYYDAEDMNIISTVTFIAENEIEAEWLRCSYFQNFGKCQLHIIFLKDEVFV
jgi:hypothetical protein